MGAAARIPTPEEVCLTPFEEVSNDREFPFRVVRAFRGSQTRGLFSLMA